MLFVSLLVLVFVSIMIMYACDSFEEAADFLSSNMKEGTKGRTINAIGSSLPELFTVMILLFGPIWLPAVFSSREDGFSAGIATCAGSAIFNAAIIPALCLLAVFIVGVKKGGVVKKIKSVTLDKKQIMFDGFFFVSAELVLIYFLRDSFLVWWMGAWLVLIFVIYVAVALSPLGFKDEDDEADEEDDEDEDEDDGGGIGILGQKWLLDFNQRLFNGQEFNTKRAWIVLGCSVVAIAIACAGIA